MPRQTIFVVIVSFTNFFSFSKMTFQFFFIVLFSFVKSFNNLAVLAEYPFFDIVRLLILPPLLHIVP